MNFDIKAIGRILPRWDGVPKSSSRKIQQFQENATLGKKIVIKDKMPFLINSAELINFVFKWLCIHKQESLLI